MDFFSIVAVIGARWKHIIDFFLVGVRFEFSMVNYMVFFEAVGYTPHFVVELLMDRYKRNIEPIKLPIGN